MVWLRPAVSLPPNTIITDYPSPRFARNGTLQYWYEITGAANHYANGQMFWTWNRNDTYDNWASWHVPGTAGYQEVFAFVPWDHATSTRARYRIGLPNNPSPPYVEVNQNNLYAEWVSLGVWSFGSQDENWVTLSDRTYEAAGTTMVGFDAIAMVRRGRVFLPVQIRGSAPARKLYSGMHLGNHTQDWSATLLQRIDPARGGMWPSAVVVLSSQVYYIDRWPSNGVNPCRVRSVWALPDRPVIWDYLKRAGQAGVKIIVRVDPSPGNFIDWNSQDHHNHHLLDSSYPAGPNWCQPLLYRSVADIADEIGAIHTLNVSQGFSEYGFEPANEPNHEWYDKMNSVPEVFKGEVWEEMDRYFANIHYYVHQWINPAIRVLTPPMAPSRYAELRNVADYDPDGGTCQSMPLIPTGLSGYETMTRTYGIYAAGANDGVAWHNYWFYGKEGYNFCPDGQHVSLYFPSGMKNAITSSGDASFVTESDLSSSGWGGIPTKDDVYAATVASSTRQFIWMEHKTNGFNTDVVVWLLSDDTGTAEHMWHQAYTTTTQIERGWFPAWWNGNELWP